MKLLVAASNEIPEEGSGLEAIWDRFILRVISESVKDEHNFYKMLNGVQDEKINIKAKDLITAEVYSQWQDEIRKVQIPQEIMLYLTQLRKILSQKGENTTNIYVSDRRWVKVARLLRTSAFLKNVLVGMHPSFRQVPPTCPASIRMTSTPLLAASRAVS